MKKRVLALLLVLALCVCLAPMAFAAAEEPVVEPEEIAEVSEESPAEEEPAEAVELTEIELIPAEEGDETNYSTLTLALSPALSPVKTAYDAGDTIVLTVGIANEGTAAPVGLDITFNFDGFTVKEAVVTGTNVNGAFSKSGDHLLTLSYESGESGGVTAKVLSGSIATITLVAPRQTVADTKDYTFTATVNGALNIEEETVDFAATTVQKTVTVNMANTLLGDVNGDGEVTNKDSLLLFKYVSEQITEAELKDFAAADVNDDTEVTNKDSLLLFKFVSEQISSF